MGPILSGLTAQAFIQETLPSVKAGIKTVWSAEDMMAELLATQNLCQQLVLAINALEPATKTVTGETLAQIKALPAYQASLASAIAKGNKGAAAYQIALGCVPPQDELNAMAENPTAWFPTF
jgi:hypothetical protein